MGPPEVPCVALAKAVPGRDVPARELIARPDVRRPIVKATYMYPNDRRTS